MLVLCCLPVWWLHQSTQLMGLGRRAAAGSCKECCECVFLLGEKQCQLKVFFCCVMNVAYSASGSACLCCFRGAGTGYADQFHWFGPCTGTAASGLQHIALHFPNRLLASAAVCLILSASARLEFFIIVICFQMQLSYSSFLFGYILQLS